MADIYAVPRTPPSPSSQSPQFQSILPHALTMSDSPNSRYGIPDPEYAAAFAMLKPSPFPTELDQLRMGYNEIVTPIYREYHKAHLPEGVCSVALSSAEAEAADAQRRNIRPRITRCLLRMAWRTSSSALSFPQLRKVQHSPLFTGFTEEVSRSMCQKH